MRGLICSWISPSEGPIAEYPRGATHRPRSASERATKRPVPGILVKVIAHPVLHECDCRSVTHDARNLLMYHVSGANERCRHVVTANDRAIGDSIPQSLAMHEGVELPFTAQWSGIPYFCERIQCPAGLVETRAPVIVIDDACALPGNTHIRGPGAGQSSQGKPERRAYLIAVIAACDLVQVVELAGYTRIFEGPLGPCQVSNPAGPGWDFPEALGVLAASVDDWSFAANSSRSGTSDEDVLQVAAIKEDAVVTRARYETDRVRFTFKECDPGIQIVDEESLAVVAELRNDNQRDILSVNHGIGSNAGAQGDTQVPAPHGDTLIG